MRRPLAVFCTLLLSIVWCVRLLIPEESDSSFEVWNGESFYLEGTVTDRYDQVKDGEKVLVLTVKEGYLFDNRTYRKWKGSVSKKTGVLSGSADGSSSVLSDYSIINSIEQLKRSDPKTLKQSGYLAGADLLLCKMDTEQVPAIGEHVLIKGKGRCFSAIRNPGEFDLRQYYRTMKIKMMITGGTLISGDGARNTLRDDLYRLRDLLGEAADAVFTERDATVMRTILLGEKKQLDQAVKKRYQESGIIHILSISGLHISLLGMGLYRLLRKMRIPVLVCCFVSGTVMICYGIMTGLSPSAVRAILMFCLYLTAKLLGRTYDLITALAVAAAVLGCSQPEYLVYSGFLYSFAAVLSLTILLPALTELLGVGEEWNRGAPPPKGPAIRTLIRKKGMETALGMCAIFLGTLPVGLYLNYEYPLVSMVLNPLIVPLVGVLMIVGLLAILGVFFFSPLAYLGGTGVHLILLYYDKMCELGGKMPFSHLICGKPHPLRIMLYLAMLGFAFYVGRKMPKLWTLLWLALTVLLLIRPAPFQNGITMIDVGQGDGIYLEDELGSRILIDGGSSSESQVGEYTLEPFLKSKGVGALDAVFLSHLDLDHYSGILELIADTSADRIRITTLFVTRQILEDESEARDQLLACAEQAGTRVCELKAGDEVRIGQWRLDCLWPSGAVSGERGIPKEDGKNEKSMVLFASLESSHLFREGSCLEVLLMGDLEGAGEDEVTRMLQRQEKRSAEESGNQEGENIKTFRVLKVAHHGSAGASGEKFLRACGADLALLSAGVDNRYGHPHQELLLRLENAGIPRMTTQECGAIRIRETNGWYEIIPFLREKGEYCYTNRDM